MTSHQDESPNPLRILNLIGLALLALLVLSPLVVDLHDHGHADGDQALATAIEDAATPGK
ncbi:MAG: hypothetical protein VX672_08410 [Planctomycetota bacterium]|nr:hypothetical protein [Planctomycetota bacterium]